MKNFWMEKVMENAAERRVRAQVQLIDKLIRRNSSQSGSNILHASKGGFYDLKNPRSIA